MIEKICSLLFFFYYSFYLIAQTTATGHVVCEVISPLKINNVSGLEFGEIEKSEENKILVVNPILTTSSETIIEFFNNTSEINATITESSPTNQVSYPAIFNLSGSPNSIYTISLPAFILLTRIGGTEKMLVNSFVSLPPQKGKLDIYGTGALSVGATLHIDKNQMPGIYKSIGDFKLIVIYE